MRQHIFQASFVILLSQTVLPAVDWRPIDPADLALKSARVDKDASAEGLFWEVKVKDEFKQQDEWIELRNYIRIKIFTDKGRDNATVELYYGKKSHIGDLAARTVKPDGSVVEMQKDAVFDTRVVKSGGRTLNARKFVIPNVEPGDIIEYQWRETISDAVSNYFQFPVQRDLPIEKVRYLVKPLQLPYLPYAMRAMYFQVPEVKFQADQQGYFRADFDNIPAFHEEAYMPNEDAIRKSIMLFYAPDDDRTPEKYWAKFGKEVYRETKDRIKINSEMKSTAAEAVSGAANDEEKVRKIFDYCRKHIKNTASRQGDVTPDEIRDKKANQNTADTLRQGIGTGRDINLLFVAMLQAVGMDARIAKLGDASSIPWVTQSYFDSVFVPSEDVAVDLGGKWRLFDPGTPGLPFGMLRWQEQGIRALVSDPKKPEWVDTAPVPAADNSIKRKATLEVTDDGTLQGDVSERYFGLRAYEKRREMIGLSGADSEKKVDEAVKEYASTAAVSDVKVRDQNDCELPLSISFHVKIPGYAARTNKRLLVQPAIFHANVTPRFTSATRYNPLLFPYGYTDEDDVTINLPQGFSLDHAQVPGAIDTKLFHFKVRASVTDQNLLTFHREFRMGDGGPMAFTSENYKPLKAFFDAMQDGDNRSLTFKLAEAGKK